MVCPKNIKGNRRSLLFTSSISLYIYDSNKYSHRYNDSSVLAIIFRKAQSVPP